MSLFNIDVVWEFWPVFLRGLGLTVFLTFVVIVLAGLLAVPLALGRLSKRGWIRFVAGAYVEFMRATPLILQLIYIYYVLPMAGVRLEPVIAAIVGLTLNYAAYMSEVYRSGIEAVSRDQYEAAQSLGIKPWVIFIKIIFPQAFRIVLPALGNYLIALFKDTALASVVTVQELMFSGQIIAARNYQYFTVYTITAMLYFAVGYPASLLVRRLEVWSKKGWSA